MSTSRRSPRCRFVTKHAYVGDEARVQQQQPLLPSRTLQLTLSDFTDRIIASCSLNASVAAANLERKNRKPRSGVAPAAAAAALLAAANVDAFLCESRADVTCKHFIQPPFHS
jgi:hypothetical protein